MITKNNILELIKEQKKFENKFRNLNSRNFNLLSNSEKRYISFYYINEINKLNDIALLNEYQVYDRFEEYCSLVSFKRFSEIK
jgi:hypothetical protein